MQYRHYNTNVGGNYKHIVFSTKYRWEILKPEIIKKTCKEIIEQVCKKHGIKIENLNVQDDHVHIMVDCPRTMSDAKLIQLLKGASSFYLFRAMPGLRKIYPKGHFWSRGYFCSNIGTDYKRTFDYIENQSHA